jgi:hypothetical protein
MPYKSLTDINPALKGIRPRISLEQANEIAKVADGIGEDKKGWPIAIAQFKKQHTVRKGKWVKREPKEKQEETMTEPIPAEDPIEEGYVPYNIKTFADLEARREADEVARTLSETVDDFIGLLNNITYDAMVTDKVSAMQTLWGEFIRVMETMFSEPAESNGLVEMAESFAQEAIEVTEAEAGKPDLLYMDVQIIRPGWGNTRDNNFYPREMLAKHAEKFVGAKMYESDHGADKTTRNWVSTIQEIKGFTGDGAPVARVAVHDPGFAQRVRNLKAAGLLEKMECSILASGSAKPFEAGGRKGRTVESITEVSSVDWVTRAGAGGKALSLAENGGNMEQEKNQAGETTKTQENAPAPEPVKITEAAPAVLAAAEAVKLLTEANLPEPARVRLEGMTWKDAKELQEAVAKEREYIKQLTGSGRPFGMAESAPKPENTAELVEKRKDEVISKYMK